MCLSSEDVGGQVLGVCVDGCREDGDGFLVVFVGKGLLGFLVGVHNKCLLINQLVMIDNRMMIIGGMEIQKNMRFN